MEASINERHLKDFVRLLQCASRYGEELCIHANKDHWELAVTNSSKSAFCLFKLQPRFFSRYKALGTPSEQRKGVKCKLLVKSVLAVVSKTSTTASIERLDLKIYDPTGNLRARSSSASASSGTVGDTTGSNLSHHFDDDYHEEINMRGSVLVVRLVCKHGVTKKHTLNLGSTDFDRAIVDPDSTPSSFTISARTLRNWLDHFSLTSNSGSSAHNPARAENQLGWMFGKNEVRLKSWAGSDKDLCTEIKVDVAEFGTDREGQDRYWVEQERVDLTLPMKEFRATLQLADSMSIDLTIAFSESSQPLTMVYTGGEEDDFDIFCAIATMACDAFPVDLGRPAANGQAPAPPPVGGLDPKGRRIVSDLTEDGHPQRPGPEQAEGSVQRQRSQTPSRRTSRLELTPSNRVGSERPAVVYNSQPTQAQGWRSSQVGNGVGSSQLGHGGGAGSSQVGNGEPGLGDVGEPLFLANSQEEQDEPMPAQSQRMTQEEALQRAGISQADVDSFLNEADAEDDEEWNKARQAQQLAGKAEPEMPGPDDWDDADLQHEGGRFEADNSVFDDMSFNPPSSMPTTIPRHPGPPPRLSPAKRAYTSPTRQPLPAKTSTRSERLPTRSPPTRVERRRSAQSVRDSTGAGPSGRASLSRSRSPLKVTPIARMQARVRSQTEEEREEMGGVEVGPSRSSEREMRTPPTGQGAMLQGDDQDDDEEMAQSQRSPDGFQAFFDD